MKLICYILLILLIPAIPVGAQTLSGGQVQVSNQSILISDDRNGYHVAGCNGAFFQLCGNSDSGFEDTG
jgi:hypothetical protein